MGQSNYYREWEVPEGSSWERYNALEEFDYARDHGRLGFVFWAMVNQPDTAEGINNDVWWDWAGRAASRRGLPSVINTQLVGATWLLNRYRRETMMKMPQYCGAFHSVASPDMGGLGVLSWCSGDGRDAELANLQKIVRQYVGQENVIEFLEPHGEPNHGDYDLFLEYGPVADESFRTYLKQKYADPGVLRRRWGATSLRSWSDVRVPELASFFGFDKEALDLSGEWRIAHPEGGEAPADWMAEGFNDSSWATVTTPGHDRTMFLPKKPAVYRRAFQVSGSWTRRHRRVWLYVWDLNQDWGKVVSVALNGKPVGRSPIVHAESHWCALEVTDALKPGRNLLALSLPQGYIAYRVYLSPHEPVQYPRLGQHMNARWADLIDWREWTRIEAIRRGIAMIREVDPDRSITLMAASVHAGRIRELCEDYGGRFHDTGFMAACWAELLPMHMRAADLPFSLEPGSPARTLQEFKRFMGLWVTEGVNAIQYFIHVGNILWDDGIRRHFEEILPIVRMIGKYHVPKAECAQLLSDRTEHLTGFPWGYDPNVNLRSGYFWWRVNEFLLEYPMDGLTELDFSNGNADAYRVVIDTNTSVMDDDVVRDIEAWVRKGGVFVTLAQTGRHTSTDCDAWPISRLTGYKVTAVDPHAADGRATMRKFNVAPGQTLIPDLGVGLGERANGLSLKKVAPECRDLLLWEDGAVAAGVRPIGKGYVVHLGLKFSHNRIWWDGRENTKSLLRHLLDWCKVRAVPASVAAGEVILRRYVSNNGLYDVWAMWNSNKDREAVADLVFSPEIRPAFCFDVRSGTRVPLEQQADGRRLRNLRFPPHEMKMYMTPRGEIASAPLAWFNLQRNWWRGTRKPETKALPEVKWEHALDLTEDWAFLPLDAGAGDLAAMAAPDFDDAGWKRMRLGVWAVPEELDSRHVLFRKRFVVPAEWKAGEIRLWIRSWFHATLAGRMRVWLDGREIKALHPPQEGVEGLRITEDVRPGGTHCLAVEIVGEGSLVGPRGNAWLSYVPGPKSKLDLAGEWTPTRDAMRYGTPVRLPGTLDALMARRTIVVPRAASGTNVFLHMEGGRLLLGVLVNGHWVRRQHHGLGDVTHLNVTPWIIFGGQNEIEIVHWDGPDKSEVREVALWLYDPGTYP